MSGQPEEILGSHHPTLAWNVLSDRVEALVAAWESSAEPPQIADYLPAEPANLRYLALVELIKVDMEYRCQRPEHARRIEQYLDEFPELTERGAIPCDLIYEEYHLRKQSGQKVAAEEYFERFPRQATELGRLLGLESPHLSTSVVGAGRFEEIEVGDSIDDFDLLTRLGRGAFAVVFLARQKSMQRIVALKVSADRGSEPQTMALLDHPHIVRVFDQRRLVERKLRLLYMQYVPGGTLQTVIDGIRRLPPSMRSGIRLLEIIDQALAERGDSPPSDSPLRHRLAAATWPQAVCWLGSRLAAALAYAHQRGVLHRDIKPANVLVAADGTPKLADFNISYSSKVEGSSAAAYFGGSLAYMSPEQIEACNPASGRTADDLDNRSDIYSLGVMLWELLTGNRPFDDTPPGSDWTNTLSTMLAARRQGVGAAMIAQLPRDCPSGLKQILLSCLALEPSARPSAGQLSRQLELALEPQVMRLLRPRPGAWRNWVRRYPLTAMFAAGLLPNLIFTALNLAYNIPAIFEALGKSLYDVMIDPVVSMVNGMAFGIGIAILLPFTWPVARAVARIYRGEPRPTDHDPRWRIRALLLADCTALVSAVEWFVTGFIFPTWLSREVPHEQFHAGVIYTHFLASQALCGMMASTLAFFLVCFLSVRAFYPTLFQAEHTDMSALGMVRRLQQRAWLYFGVAVVVPPLATIVMVLVRTIASESTPPVIFGVLGLVGLINSGLIFVLLRAVQNALVALAIAVSPPGTVTIGGGDSVSDSFWR
ncbi:MAG TPA: serine/threonine-protein kinase [Pirellulales bacterium]|nr:serine/threonine-protein kinase [Pirellulales bacterium]